MPYHDKRHGAWLQVIWWGARGVDVGGECCVVHGVCGGQGGVGRHVHGIKRGVLGDGRRRDVGGWRRRCWGWCTAG